MLAEITLEELELGVRAYNVLKRLGVNTAADLVELRLSDLLAWELSSRQRLGSRALDEIRAALRITDNAAEPCDCGAVRGPSGGFVDHEPGSPGCELEREPTWEMVLELEDVPNPVIGTRPAPGGGTARLYRNGKVDATDGDLYSLSPGFDSFQELEAWHREERSLAGL